MSLRPLRVVVWATGGIGSIAIRTVHERPGLELAGVWVHSPDKNGRDAGDIANGQPIGVLATNDADALIAAKPDCIVYAANSPGRDDDAIQDYVRFLRAGINVVSTSATRSIYPKAYADKWRIPLDEAAREGGASFYASGIEPGFAGDHLPLLLTTQSKTIRSIHVYEIGMYDDYPVADIMMDAMGFGRPLDYQPWMAMPGAIMDSWVGPIRMIAEAVGVEIDEFREVFERVETPRKLEVACGTLEAGTCGALRFQTIGVVDGRDAIIIEHVTRMDRNLAPHWATSEHEVGYRIVIKGEPDIYCDMGLELADPRAAGIGGMTGGAGAMVATAMRVVNAIPEVVAARPGLLGALDIPLTVPTGAFRAGDLD